MSTTMGRSGIISSSPAVHNKLLHLRPYRTALLGQQLPPQSLQLVQARAPQERSSRQPPQAILLPLPAPLTLMAGWAARLIPGALLLQLARAAAMTRLAPSPLLFALLVYSIATTAAAFYYAAAAGTAAASATTAARPAPPTTAPLLPDSIALMEEEQRQQSPAAKCLVCEEQCKVCGGRGTTQTRWEQDIPCPCCLGRGCGKVQLRR